MSTSETVNGGEWEPTGARTIRARSETNRITTLTRESLEEADLETDTDMAIYAREGEVRLYPWEDGIPAEVAEEFYPCGVREIHTSGTSTVITLTDRALVTAGFGEGTKLQQEGKAGLRGLRLSTEGPDLRRGGEE